MVVDAERQMEGEMWTEMVVDHRVGVELENQCHIVAAGQKPCMRPKQEMGNKRFQSQALVNTLLVTVRIYKTRRDVKGDQ